MSNYKLFFKDMYSMVRLDEAEGTWQCNIIDNILNMCYHCHIYGLSVENDNDFNFMKSCTDYFGVDLDYHF